jgi:iron complex outermembrane receptor protein
MDPVVKDWLTNVDGRIFNYDKGVQQYGLLRNFYHGNVGMDWEVTDSLTLSSLTALNREEYSVFVDLDNQGTLNIARPQNTDRPVFDYPYLVERLNQDFSQELRLSFDNGGPIQATLGASYLNATTRAGVGGGFLPGASYAEMGKTRSKTTGVFGAVTWQATPNFSISGEGRYQEDVLYAYSQPTGTTLSAVTAAELGMETYYAGGDILFKQKYKNFLPRVIAKYETDGGMMAYASWSKGVNPGAFNTEFLTTPDNVIEEATEQGIGVQVEPEKVTNYELGLKGTLFDRRVNFALAVYFAEWRNQINAISLYTTTPVLDDDGAPVVPAESEAYVLAGSANTGEVDMKGIELDLNWRATDNISFNFGGALNDTVILKHANPPVSRVTGVTNFAGNELPQTSKWSANFGAEYAGDVLFIDGADWFIRGDYAFKSGMWSSAANVVKTMDSHKVNARLGLNHGPLSYELFVQNLFNNKAYTSIGEQSLFEKNFAYSSAYSALVGGLPELRTVGAKISYKF